MVLFKGQRYRWKGTRFEYGSLCMIIEQDGKGKNGKTTSYLPLERNKHLIKPYYGESLVTDGRGVKKRSTNREDFLSYIFGMDVAEIPTQIDVSVVIVAERNSFGEICKQVRIVYGGEKSVSLLDIIPAAYYTGSGDEYQYGLNPAKAEPVLKVTSKISTARDLVLDNHGNKVVGLLVTDGIRKIAHTYTTDGEHIPVAEVKFVGSFVTGEQILFSKYYVAAVFDAASESVTEKSPEQLLPGDVLVFVKRDDYTKNIVPLKL